MEPIVILVRFGIMAVMIYLIGCIAISGLKASNGKCDKTNAKYNIERYLNGDLFCETKK